MANAAVGGSVVARVCRRRGDSGGGEFAGRGFRGIGPALAGNVGIGEAFALCAGGIRMLTFLCSLRPGPAIAGCGQPTKGGLGGGPESAGRGSEGRPAAANSEAAGPNTHAIRTRDAEHPGSLPQNHLPGGFGGNSPRMSCCLRYHSRRVRESMVSLKSLKLAMFRAPSMSSFRDLLRSPLASVAHPR